MNYSLKKKIYAILFLILICSWSGYNIYSYYDDLGAVIQEQITQKSYDKAALEEEIRDCVAYEDEFEYAYSETLVLMQKRELNNYQVIKDENGFLNSGILYHEDDKNVLEYALRVKRLDDFVKGYGGRLIYVLPPAKGAVDNKAYRMGLTANDPTNLMNEMVLYLRRLGINTIDVRDSIPGDALTYEQTFYKTDYHWTIPAAFEVTNLIISNINASYRKDIDPDGKVRDISNYEVEYKAGMVGNFGQITGVPFSGTDDFVAYVPKDSGTYKRKSYSKNMSVSVTTGNLKDVMFDYSHLEDGGENCYQFYMDGLKTMELIDNLDSENDIDMLFICDSFFTPVITFMAPMCDEVDAIWAMEDSKELNIEDYLKKEIESGNRYEYVIVGVAPGSIGEAAFNYFKKAGDG